MLARRVPGSFRWGSVSNLSTPVPLAEQTSHPEPSEGTRTEPVAEIIMLRVRRLGSVFQPGPSTLGQDE